MAPHCRRCKIAAAMMTPRPLDSDTVRVRWLAVDAEAAAHQPRWRAMLDADELAQADRYYFESDRAVYTAAHALARAMLSEATGLPTASWRYTKRAFGKPALAEACAGCGLRFNISHTHGFVACAIARDEVGVDVEASDRRTNFAIADRFFAPEEAQLVNAASGERQRILFFRFWTLKEAFIKATGEGLRRPLDSFSFSFDPLRVAFHPEREDTPRYDDPAGWQFFTRLAAPDRPLALAVRRDQALALRLDMGTATAGEVMAWA